MKAYDYEEFKKERLSDPHLKTEYDLWKKNSHYQKK